MSTDTIVRLPDQGTARIPRVNFLNKENGLLSWLLTGDHKRIATLYLISITFLLRHRRRAGRTHSPGAAHPAVGPDGRGHLQQGVLDARHHHGLFVPGAVGSGHAGQFPHAHDDRRQGPGAAQDQPAELVSLHHRRDDDALDHDRRAAWTRAGPSPFRSPRTT